MGKKITMITIDTVFNKEDGERKVAKLQKITKGNYHNYQYGVCPMRGGFDIVVTTDYEIDCQDPEKEMLQDFIYILVNRI